MQDFYNAIDRPGGPFAADFVSARAEQTYAAEMDPARADRTLGEGAAKAMGYVESNDSSSTLDYIHHCQEIYASLGGFTPNGGASAYAESPSLMAGPNVDCAVTA